MKKQIITHFVTIQPDVSNDISVLWNLDNEGVGDLDPWSVQDHKVSSFRKQEYRLVNGHYELPIPWKKGTQVPDNYSVASMRLKSTKKLLIRHSLYQTYHEVVQKLLKEGYTQLVPSEKVPPETKVWYLPHQTVISERPGKMRVVFDCSAKFNGESLNDKCLQGLNLINKLLNVLLRFREHTYDFVADIQAMYYQVLIPEDRNASRFLWFNDDGDITEYRMTRHVFGGVWCASSSTFALRQVLKDNPEIEKDGTDTILRSFYVDDCLKPIANCDQVLPLTKDVTQALSKGGFCLNNLTNTRRQAWERC